MKETKWRIERDSMGEIRIPATALWGAQTQRAIHNFPISGIRFPNEFITALAWIKRSCARANCDLNHLPRKTCSAIITACDEIIQGQWNDQFPLDVFQTGSGTSTNMNINEVIANRSIQILGSEPGKRDLIHPNDHVNAGQSSNDVIPTAIHVAAGQAVSMSLIPSFRQLQIALFEKSLEFHNVVKTGRTHLQDATPVKMGQVFRGYETQVRNAIKRLHHAIECLREVPLGGTAVGTGLNRPAAFHLLAINYLNRSLSEQFRGADNAMEANAARDACLEVSGLIRCAAGSLGKIANDIRWLSSGPRNGLGEIILPAVQPGSSIMPGKINPVIPESVLMVMAQVNGNDEIIASAVQAGQFELNTMMPLIAHTLLLSIRILSNAAKVFTSKCLMGLDVDREHCAKTLERNLSLATGLAPLIGYDKAADIAKEAWISNRTIRDVAEAWNVLPGKDLDRALDPARMTRPGFPDPS